jgi:hypothetical protein
MPRKPSEVVADDPDIQLAQEIALDAIELVRTIFVADRRIDENARVAALAEVGAALEFARRTANRLQGLPGVPTGRPGSALERLGWALDDLEKGIVGPMVSPAAKPRRGSAPDKTGTIRGKRPPQPTKVQMLQAEVAATMQLLMLGGRLRVDAAKEAAGKLKGHPILAGIKGAPWRTIAGWRDAISAGSVSPTAIQYYNSFLTEADRLTEAMSVNRKEALIKIAHDKLQHLEPPPERPRKSGSE